MIFTNKHLSTFIGLLAWLSVIGVFITLMPEVFLLSALVLFWLRGYIEDCRKIPTLTIRLDRQQ